MDNTITRLTNIELYQRSRELERELGALAAINEEYIFIKKVIATRSGYAHPDPKY